MPENPALPPVQPPLTPPPSAPLPASEKDTRMWNMLCHLSALSGYVIPLGNVLGPLIVWQIKKDEIPSVIVHGKAALNFQLSVLIGIIASIVVGFLLLAFCIGIVFFFAAGALGLCGVIFAIIAGIKANEGKEYAYPYSLNLIN